MPTYRLRFVAEAGFDPVDGATLGHDEETLTVEADSPWAARSLALHRTTLRPVGRVLRVYDATTGDEIVRPPPAGFRPGRFTIDGLPGTYNGYTRGETWNGWAVPYFSLDIARRVAGDYAAQPAGLDGQPEAEYDADRDLVRLYDPSSGEWDEYGRVEIDDGTGYGLRVFYPVGAHYWTWEEACEPAETTE